MRGDKKGPYTSHEVLALPCVHPVRRRVESGHHFLIQAQMLLYDDFLLPRKPTAKFSRTRGDMQVSTCREIAKVTLQILGYALL